MYKKSSKHHCSAFSSEESSSSRIPFSPRTQPPILDSSSKLRDPPILRHPGSSMQSHLCLFLNIKLLIKKSWFFWLNHLCTNRFRCLMSFSIAVPSAKSSQLSELTQCAGAMVISNIAFIVVTWDPLLLHMMRLSFSVLNYLMGLLRLGSWQKFLLIEVISLFGMMDRVQRCIIILSPMRLVNLMKISQTFKITFILMSQRERGLELAWFRVRRWDFVCLRRSLSTEKYIRYRFTRYREQFDDIRWHF